MGRYIKSAGVINSITQPLKRDSLSYNNLIDELVIKDRLNKIFNKTSQRSRSMGDLGLPPGWEADKPTEDNPSTGNVPISKGSKELISKMIKGLTGIISTNSFVRGDIVDLYQMSKQIIKLELSMLNEKERSELSNLSDEERLKKVYGPDYRRFQPEAPTPNKGKQPDNGPENIFAEIWETDDGTWAASIYEKTEFDNFDLLSDADGDSEEDIRSKILGRYPGAQINIVNN